MKAWVAFTAFLGGWLAAFVAAAVYAPFWGVLVLVAVFCFVICGLVVAS